MCGPSHSLPLLPQEAVTLISELLFQCLCICFYRVCIDSLNIWHFYVFFNFTNSNMHVSFKLIFFAYAFQIYQY